MSLKKSTILLAVLSPISSIDDKDSINTSFPIFLKILKKLGAKIN